MGRQPTRAFKESSKTRGNFNLLVFIFRAYRYGSVLNVKGWMVITSRYKKKGLAIVLNFTNKGPVGPLGKTILTTERFLRISSGMVLYI